LFAFIFLGFLWIPIIFLVSLLCGFAERKWINKRQTQAPGTAVVVTGCSSGFGFSLATGLANKGVYVFAGVRKEEDAEKLREAVTEEGRGNLQTLILDVTNEQHVLDASEVVAKELESKGLRFLALVNNAGYATYGPVESMGIARMRKMYEVNVFGVVSMIQAFVPLLRKYYAKEPLNSRIINVSSVGGVMSLPNAGPYCASKYAIESISDSLRMELRPWGISVSVVEPGRFATEFQGKAYSDMVSDGIKQLDEEVYNHYNILTNETNANSAKTKRPPPSNCAQIMEDAIFDTHPLERYYAGTDSQILIPLLHFLKNEKINDLILGRGWGKLRK